MKKNGQLRVGAVLSYVNLVVGNIIALIYTPFMLKCLGQAEYGTYTTIVSIVNYLTIFDLGFSNVIVRYGAQYKEEKNEKKEQDLYGGFTLIYILIGLITLGIGLYFSQHLGIFEGKFAEQELYTAKKLMILAVANVAISFPLGVFRAILTVNERYSFLKFVDFARTVLSPLCIVILLLQGYKAIALMAVTVFMNIAVMIMHALYCFCVLHVKLHFTIFPKTFMTEIISYSSLVAIGMVVDKIYWSTDQVILAAVQGPEATAVYSIGVTFPSYFISFSLAISNVLLPRVTMIASSNEDTAKKNEDLSNIFLKVGRIQYWILMLILTGFILWGKEFIIDLWVGKGYENAYIIALIVMIPSIVSLTQNVGISILQAKKKLKFRTYTNLFIALLNIVISIPLSQRFGGIGAALGTSIGTVLGPIVCMNFYYWKKADIDIPQYWKNFLTMSCSVIAPILCGVVIKSIIHVTSYVALGISAVLYTLVYGVSTYMWGMNDYEKEEIRKIVKKKKQRI